VAETDFGAPAVTGAALPTTPVAPAPEAPTPERGRFGFFSLVLAVAAFVSAVVALTVFVQVPKTAPDTLRNIVTVCFIVIFLVAAPLAHLTGFVLGLVALFHRNDRRVAGAFGIILNGLALAAGVIVVMAGLQGLAAFH
jgi:hypothetical protein